VAVRSVQNGLVMHFMYFANEIRDFDQIPKPKGEKIPKREIDLAGDLMDKMSAAEFEPEKYYDEYRERYLAMIDQKVKGQEITIASPSARTRPRKGGRYLRGAETKPRASRTTKAAGHKPTCGKVRAQTTKSLKSLHALAGAPCATVFKFRRPVVFGECRSQS
jgi:DNA end-binding protein Ku